VIAALGTAISALPFDVLRLTVALKGVFLAGLEVAFIVITFGSARADWIALATAAAAAALVVVAIAGAVARAPLSRVPENSLKFVVGLLLTTFGTRWAAEGAHVEWSGDDAALVAILALLAVASLLAVRVLPRRRASRLTVHRPAEATT
jgi:uncharacterized membrane protein